MGISLPVCCSCKHYREGKTCAAFPSGIPREIYWNHHDHRLPYPGDQGVRFEPADTELGRWVARRHALHPPLDRAKVAALKRRVFAPAVYPHLRAVLAERGASIWRLGRIVGRKESFEELPAVYQEIVLEAERRQGEKR